MGTKKEVSVGSPRRAADSTLSSLLQATKRGGCGACLGRGRTCSRSAEWKRPLQSVGYFLVGADGIIRWERVEPRMFLLPKAEEILPFV